MSDMAVLLQRGDGKPELFPLQGWGGERRLSFGEPGKRAAIWKITVTPAGEVYLMERSTGRYLKISLHKSGDWRFQWIEGHLHRQPLVQKLVAAQGTRIIDQWDRPAPTSGGLTLGFTVWTTAEDICDVPGDAPPENVIWLDPPVPGEVGCISVVLLKPIGEVVRIRGYVPIAAIPMKTREVVMILAARRRMKDHEREDLKQHRDFLRAKLTSPTATMRAIIPRVNDEGARHVLDLAVIPRPGDS